MWGVSTVDARIAEAANGWRLDRALADAIPTLSRERIKALISSGNALFETILAFADKQPLLHGISAALAPGGRLAFTIEAGEPLTEAERARMPDADTVWLTPLEEMRTYLERAGLLVGWQDDLSQAHQQMADALVDAFACHAAALTTQIGRQAVDELLAAHRLWSDWLRDGRVRKLAIVADKPR